MIKYSFLFRFTILAVCIIYFIFLFNVFCNDAKTKETTKTYSDLEKVFCLTVKEKSSNTRNCPQNGIVTAASGGRLGNQIWEYASVLAVAKKTGLQPYIPECIKLTLEALFDNLTIPTLGEIGHCPLQHFKSIRYIQDYYSTSNHSIILEKYNVQPELVSTYWQDIIKELSIKKKLLEESQKVLHSVIKSLNRTFETFIGVHIRRSDYIEFVRQRYRVKPAYKDYYKSAIGYFYKKYQNSVFLIVTDDPVWCKRHLGSMQNCYVYSKLDLRSPPELDLAILSSCNHSIIDYGTFGQWGALMAGGEPVFYKINQNYSSERLSKSMLKWHTLGNRI